MRYWLFAEPILNSSEPIWMIYSDDAILAEYWDRWKTEGFAYNKSNGFEEYKGVTPLRCIEDWVTIHWAVPATPENLINIISAPKPQLL
jgi:hypothetical protein